MIARLHVKLPFSFTVPDGEVFTVWEHEVQGCGVRVYPPQKSTGMGTPHGQELLINGVKAIQADVLWIDFVRSQFDRRIGADCDPTYGVMGEAVNDFIERLRYVAKASHIKALEFPNVSWSLSYLDDNENELAEEAGFLRGRGSRVFSFSWTALNVDVWNNIHQLPPGWRPPAWQSLLLDANGELPEVGPALVLAATALEVFIAQTLDILVVNHETPPEIWEWIKGRDWLKRPSGEEQFDFLLQQFGGKTLKSDSRLWEGFKHLKAARNSFVHNGLPMIGKEVVGVERARKLIALAVEIIEFVKSALPKEHQWPEFEHKFNLSLIQQLYQADEGVPDETA